VLWSSLRRILEVFAVVVRLLIAAFVCSLASLPSALAAEKPVKATPAYREAFGTPPATEAQDCLAAVVFLPGVGVSGFMSKLSPLPLFLLNPRKAPEEAARVVVEGYPAKPREMEFLRLFPEDARLVEVVRAGKVVTVRVKSAGTGPVNPLAVQALAHTLAQFGSIQSLELMVNGRAVSKPEAPRPAVVEPPPPPRLLDVITPVHEGGEPEEIDVLFDRPIAIGSFELTLGDGSPLPSKIYQSMFDTAVVLRPEDRGVIREGMPLAVKWKVTDKKGRTAEGSRSIGLRLYRQPK
jgi:hypothetical protein